MKSPPASRPSSSSRLLAAALRITALSLAWTTAFAAPAVPRLLPAAPGLPDVLRWQDTCNVYVIRDGAAAVLIDLGDGSVLDQLPAAGITNVEWVLFTHHHREQCQGAQRLADTSTRVAVPEAERAFFERPIEFRKMQVSLEDAFTVHGASYLRPPIAPIHVDRAFQRTDLFQWHDFEIRCLHTPGNSPGAMSYLLRNGNQWIAFSGDVMLSGATMHTWFDTEWDYGFASGIQALFNSAGQLAVFDPAWLLPSHGPPILRPNPQLREYQRKLRNLDRQLVRGYDVQTFSAGTQDKVSRPTTVPWLNRVSPHLYKFQAPDFFPNFAMILADSGHALLVDCGLFDERFLDQSLALAREKLGLRAIDAIFVTHMHGDHFLEAPHLRKEWGAGIWGLDRMGPVCEHPERYNYAAMIQAYGKKFEDQPLQGVRFDRLFQPGETLDWEGFHFTVDWMPGQTEFALCLNGRIDGRLVAFTGDNLFGDTDDISHTGHEAVVGRNSAVLEEGYLYAADYLRWLNPDILVGGHSYVMDHPSKFIERFRRWGLQMRKAFVELGSQPDYRLGFDPYWVRAEPYRSRLAAGGTTTLELHLRNFKDKPAHLRIEPHALQDLRSQPALIEVDLDPNERRVVALQINTQPNAPVGVQLVAFDVTLDRERFGEWFDAMLEIQR